MKYALGVLSAIWNMLAAPLRTVREAARERDILTAGGVVLLGSWSWMLALRLAANRGADEVLAALARVSPIVDFGAKLICNLHPLALVILGAFWCLALWFIRSAVVHLAGEILGGCGKGFSMLAALGLSCAPAVLLLPIIGLCLLFAHGNLSDSPVATYWHVVAGVLHLWILALVVLSISEVHDLPLATALMVVGAIVAAIVLLSIVTALVAAVSHTSFGSLLTG